MVLVGIFIAGAVTSRGHAHDLLRASQVWLYAAILGSGEEIPGARCSRASGAAAGADRVLAARWRSGSDGDAMRTIDESRDFIGVGQAGVLVLSRLASPAHAYEAAVLELVRSGVCLAGRPVLARPP